MIFEAFLPVVDERSGRFPPGAFRDAFDELAEQFGFVETWPVYRPLRANEGEVVEQEFYRFQFDAPHTDSNLVWLINWWKVQEQRFGDGNWMIRYQLP